MSETSVGRGRSPAEIHSPGWGPRSLDSMDQHGESPEAKDYMDLTLCYEVEEEKLTLGINRVDLRPFTRESIKDQGMVLLACNPLSQSDLMSLHLQMDCM